MNTKFLVCHSYSDYDVYDIHNLVICDTKEAADNIVKLCFQQAKKPYAVEVWKAYKEKYKSLYMHITTDAKIIILLHKERSEFLRNYGVIDVERFIGELEDWDNQVDYLASIKIDNRYENYFCEEVTYYNE